MRSIKAVKPIHILIATTLFILLFHKYIRLSINHVLDARCQQKRNVIQKNRIAGKDIADSINNVNNINVYSNDGINNDGNNIIISENTDVPFQCKYLNTVRNTVVAVNFNEPLYGNVPLLKKFFDSVFGKVVFCGSKASTEYDVIQVSGEHGYQGYDCLRRAMERYPTGYSGYIHTNDDVILNYWNLNFDPNKVWIGEAFFIFRSQVLGKPPRTDWMWWKVQKAAERCEKTFQVLKNVTASEFDLTDSWKVYYNNTNNRDICTPGNSDFFYVPQKHAAAFKFLASKFVEEKVFLEAAVPTILFFLDRYELFVNVQGTYYVYLPHPGNNFYHTYNFNRTFMHPFKMFQNAVNSKFFDLA